MEIGKIIKGHANELLGLNNDLSSSRLAICLKWPLYKNFLGGQCNPRLWLNPNTNEISNKRLDGFYKGCGCRLQAKTREVTSACPAKKW